MTLFQLLNAATAQGVGKDTVVHSVLLDFRKASFRDSRDAAASVIFRAHHRVIERMEMRLNVLVAITLEVVGLGSRFRDRRVQRLHTVRQGDELGVNLVELFFGLAGHGLLKSSNACVAFLLPLGQRLQLLLDGGLVSADFRK